MAKNKKYYFVVSTDKNNTIYNYVTDHHPALELYITLPSAFRKAYDEHKGDEMKEVILFYSEITKDEYDQLYEVLQ